MFGKTAPEATSAFTCKLLVCVTSGQPRFQGKQAQERWDNGDGRSRSTFPFDRKLLRGWTLNHCTDPRIEAIVETLHHAPRRCVYRCRYRG